MEIIKQISWLRREVFPNNPTNYIVGERIVIRYAWAAKSIFLFSTGRYNLKLVSNHLLGFTNVYKLVKKTKVKVIQGQNTVFLRYHPNHLEIITTQRKEKLN